MALSYALLALLTDCPRSGYDLNKAFEGSIGYFWRASHQQIYRELARLESLGWVEATLIHQTGKPDKKIYTTTAQGQTELTIWVAQPPDMPPVKEEMLIKLFVGNLVDPEVLQNHLKQYRQQYADLLTKYIRVEVEEFADRSTLAPKDQLQYLTLRCGIHYATSRIDWCDEVLDYLETLISDTQQVEYTT